MREIILEFHCLAHRGGRRIEVRQLALDRLIFECYDHLESLQRLSDLLVGHGRV